MVSWLIENSLVVLALSAVLLVAGRFLARRPSVLHILWLVVLIKLVTPPVLGWTEIAPGPREEMEAVYVRHVHPVVTRVVESVSAGGSVAAPGAAPAVDAEPARDGVAAAPPPAPPLSVAHVVLAGWILGTFAMLALVLRCQLRVRALRRVSTSAPAWLLEDVRALCRRLGIREPDVRVVPGSFSPGTGGWLRGCVYWPDRLVRAADRAWLRPVLAHELAHLKRGDHLIAMFEAAASLVFWWHPLFWFVRARVREYAEQACDGWAMELAPVSPRSYADTLVGFRSTRAVPAGGPAARTGGLRVFKRRLTSIMRGARRAALPAPALAGAVALLVLVLPSWSFGAPASQDPQPARTGQNPEREPKQDPKPIGELVNKYRQRGTVRIAEGIEMPRIGTQLVVRPDGGERSFVFTVHEVDGRLALGRFRYGDPGVDVGDRVWLPKPPAPPQPPAVLARGRIEHVADRIVTIHLEEETRRLREGWAFSVYDGEDRLTDLRVRLLQDGFLFGEILPGEPVLEVGKTVEIRKIGNIKAYPAELQGQLGGPVRHPIGRTGKTLIADYSDNRVLEMDAAGETVWKLDEIYGAWDIELLPNKNLLVTEFSISRVREITRSNTTVWSFDDLRNPYDADRLPSGNTLIADTFEGRVVEVDADGKSVWEYDDDIRPFDAERLDNGNTLIADVLRDRVIEIDREGRLVWQVLRLPSVHDVDRLPNGNTLVTLRTSNNVVEVDPKGNVVFELSNLNSPSDADRLPNGHTLVAENSMVREFDADGNVVQKIETTWAVEANRY